MLHRIRLNMLQLVLQQMCAELHLCTLGRFILYSIRLNMFQSMLQQMCVVLNLHTFRCFILHSIRLDMLQSVLQQMRVELHLHTLECFILYSIRLNMLQSVLQQMYVSQTYVHLDVSSFTASDSTCFSRCCNRTSRTFICLSSESESIFFSCNLFLSSNFTSSRSKREKHKRII